VTEHRTVPVRLEQVACDLCGADDSEPLLDLDDILAGTTPDHFRLVRCQRCGLRYLNPRPVAEELARFYPEDYAPFTRRGIAARVRDRQRRRDVASLWRYLGPPARVLDVGCGTGDLLRAIRDCGNPEVLGIEPSAQAVRIARERWGLDVRQGDLHAVRLPPASVDTVLLSHVIEHLPSPSDTLAEITRVLRPGGALILWLPNADSWAARFWRENWIGYDVPRHLYAFTPATLGALLARHGFTVTEIRQEWLGLEWSWGLRLWARRRWGRGGIDRAFAGLHPALTALLTPVSAAAAITGRAGRILVVAHRAGECSARDLDKLMATGRQ